MTPARRSAETTEQLRTSLLEHAQRLVDRDGAAALTMRALADDAGCAVGLPYKVFVNREALVAALMRSEHQRLRKAFDRFLASAGTGTVGDNLGQYAELLLRSPAVALAQELHHKPALARTVNSDAVDTGLVAAVQQTVVKYLAAEKLRGRVDIAVDERAFGFVIAGAIHNLLVSGPAYPHPDLRRLKRMLAAVAERLVSPEPREPKNAKSK